MGFDKFGIVSFTSESKLDEFVAYLERGEVIASRCANCGKVHFPPKADCPSCPKSQVGFFPVEGEGKLLTHTVVMYGPTGFEDKAPYTLGIVEFEGGLRVFGGVSPEIKPDEIEMGMKLRLAAVRLPDDRLSYEFIKAR